MKKEKKEEFLQMVGSCEAQICSKAERHSSLTDTHVGPGCWCSLIQGLLHGYNRHKQSEKEGAN